MSQTGASDPNVRAVWQQGGNIRVQVNAHGQPQRVLIRPRRSRITHVKYHVDALIRWREVWMEGSFKSFEFLVLWVGFGVERATWEPAEMLLEHGFLHEMEDVLLVSELRALSIIDIA